MTREADVRQAGAAARPPGRTVSPLADYLNSHLLRLTNGGELARRIATQHARSPAGLTLIRIADEVAQDRAALLRIMGDLGVPARRYESLAGWLLEKAGRARSNGFLARRTSLSSLLELEALRRDVESTEGMWHALSTLSGPRAERLDPDQLSALIARAQNQADTLESLRLPAATAILNQP
ncbi:MAG: hypothetical protein ACRDP3_11590 [Streptomyces sp.]|uniref:hypothetical protein n=1 Tax=Streptomyces sp. TaxID=1931 RepID=UPI003D6BD069